MSVDLCIELDEINWSEARKSLLVSDLRTGKKRPISTDAIHLLFRIAWRQGEGVNGRAYLSERQWLNSTGLSRSSFYRDRSEVLQTELVKLLVRGSDINGTRANLQVNFLKIRQLPKLNVPSKGQSNNQVVPNKGLGSVLTGIEKSLNSDPKRHKQQKTTVSFNNEMFNDLVVSSIPHELRADITNGYELDRLLNELVDAGYSNQQIKDKLNYAKWEGMRKAYPLVMRLLNELKKDVPRLVGQTTRQVLDDDPWASTARVENGVNSVLADYIREGIGRSVE